MLWPFNGAVYPKGKSCTLFDTGFDLRQQTPRADGHCFNCASKPNKLAAIFLPGNSGSSCTPERDESMVEMPH